MQRTTRPEEQQTIFSVPLFCLSACISIAISLRQNKIVDFFFAHLLQRIDLLIPPTPLSKMHPFTETKHLFELCCMRANEPFVPHGGRTDMEMKVHLQKDSHLLLISMN